MKTKNTYKRKQKDVKTYEYNAGELGEEGLSEDVITTMDEFKQIHSEFSREMRAALEHSIDSQQKVRCCSKNNNQTQLNQLNSTQLNSTQLNSTQLTLTQLK